MTRHLSPEEFVDALEGSTPAAVESHLGECEQCRAELAEMRATLAEARSLDASEPSPLFWNHFSARIKEATSREELGRGWSIAGFGWKPLAAFAVAAGALAIGLYVRPASESILSVPGTGEPAAHEALAVMPALDDDGSWSLVTALASELDWGELSQAAAPAGPTADAAIEDLTSEQREALARLLQKEMGDS